MALENISKLQNVEKSVEEKQIEEEFNKFSEQEQGKIKPGLRNAGFYIEEKKNNFFAGATDLALEKIKDKKGTAGRFFAALSDTFKRDAKGARVNMEKIEKGEDKSVRNFMTLAGNVLKYGRTIADVAGATIASPFRYVMTGSMMFARGSEAAKEARLKNEKVIEKTRLDINEAADEAWNIYEQAQIKAGDKDVVKGDLEMAYQEQLPQDVLKRLQKNPEPGVASEVIQTVFKKHIEWSAKRIEDKIKKVESDKLLTAKEKEEKRKNIINKYSAQLKDFDRIVTKNGAVDALAMGAKYSEKGAKTVVKAIMIESLGQMAANLTDGLTSSAEASEKIMTPEKLGDQSAAKAALAAEKSAVEPPEVIIEVEIQGKTDTLSEAVEKALKQDGVPDEVKDNFIREWGKKDIEINENNRKDLLNDAIRKLSTANIKMGDGNDIQNLIYEGNKVQLNSDGSFKVIKGDGASEAKAVPEEQLRQNAEAIELKSESVVEEAVPTESAKGAPIENLPTQEELDQITQAEAEKRVETRVKGIYDHWGHGDSIEEWDVMRGKSAEDIINGDFGEPIGKGIDQAEINNREELQEYLNEAKEALGEDPKPNEATASYLERYEEQVVSHATQGAETKITSDSNNEIAAEQPIISEDSLGQLSAEAENIKEAAINGKPEYFTGNTSGNIIDNKPNLEKGIIEIQYPRDNSIEQLKINLNEKYFVIDNGTEELKHSWKHGRNIDSMEKLRNFIKEELEKSLHGDKKTIHTILEDDSNKLPENKKTIHTILE